MTKESALYQFWSSFGIPAYEVNSVPTGEDSPIFPYLTYDVKTDSFGAEAVSLTVNLWYRSTSWLDINRKSDEIGKRIGRGGAILPCDGGAIWIRRGMPFAQSYGDDPDNMVKAKYINIEAEFLTAD